MFLYAITARVMTGSLLHFSTHCVGWSDATARKSFCRVPKLAVPHRGTLIVNSKLCDLVQIAC